MKFLLFPGLQTAAIKSERREVQAHFRNVDRIQEHCEQNRQRAQALIDSHPRVKNPSEEESEGTNSLKQVIRNFRNSAQRFKSTTTTTLYKDAKFLMMKW